MIVEQGLGKYAAAGRENYTTSGRSGDRELIPPNSKLELRAKLNELTRRNPFL
jgi:hypothetical protein